MSIVNEWSPKVTGAMMINPLLSVLSWKNKQNGRDVRYTKRRVHDRFGLSDGYVCKIQLTENGNVITAAVGAGKDYNEARESALSLTQDLLREVENQKPRRIF